jgi:hypothetical protein
MPGIVLLQPPAVPEVLDDDGEAWPLGPALPPCRGRGPSIGLRLLGLPEFPASLAILPPA